MKLAMVISTYNRVIDAKVQMELVRNLWHKEKILKNITIYHLFNGKKEWYPKKHLENFLIRCKNPGFYEGAGLLIDTGIEKILKSKKKFDFIIVSSADVWLIKPVLLAKILKQMDKKTIY